MKPSLQNLRERIASKSVVVGIFGLGYVGLPLALRFSTVGIKVLGFDIDASKVSALNTSCSYCEQITTEEIRAALKNGFEATTDFRRSSELDAIIICVPTPLDSHREPDLSFVTQALDTTLPYLRAGQIVSLESTTWPGTTEEILAPRLRARGFTPGENFALVYSPEREDPGNPHYSTMDIPKIIGGITRTCLELGQNLYRHAINQMIPVANTRTAEMTKLLENIHRAVNIGLVNEMKIVADKMNIDIHEVITAASTKPFGFVPYRPGPGLGGHCIPIDPFYLTWKAREFGINTRFIELAGEVNKYMPQWVVSKVAEALNNKLKPIKGSQILILGLAYKKNIDDIRESPAVEIMELLRERGAILAYSDSHVPTFPIIGEHVFDLRSIYLDRQSVAVFDCVIIVTDHDDFDYSMISECADIIVDTRGRLRGLNVVPA